MTNNKETQDEKEMWEKLAPLLWIVTVVAILSVVWLGWQFMSTLFEGIEGKDLVANK